MSPQRHLLCGTALATSIVLTKHELDTAIACLIGSVACDVDHIPEYLKYCKDFGDTPCLEDFIQGKQFQQTHKTYVLLHGWEFVLIGIVYNYFSKRDMTSRIIKGLLTGYTLHMALDQIGNNVNAKGYFWSYRWLKNWQGDFFTKTYCRNEFKKD